ncbi:MAG: hypothetical protein HZB37_13540 [Planctomycetes bacterium]|nr:hypothetical protein [Planctomycetota bacterium]
MQNLTSRQNKILSPFLIGIVFPLISAIMLYFFKVFGFSIQAVLMTSMKIPEHAGLYTNILLVLSLCIFGLIVFVALLLINRKNYDETLRKKLGAFLIDEIDRLKKERENLLKKPFPSTPLSQLKEDGRFLDGQEEVLLHLSQWIKPPEL